MQDVKQNFRARHDSAEIKINLIGGVMKKNMALKFFCALLLTSCYNYSQQETVKVRIGIFDSRCVAMAYGRTDFLKDMEDLRTKHAKAKEEGNQELIKELEQLGPTKQVLMHQQGFSTGSVINILEKIKDKLPAIAKEKNIKMIVSKWEVIFVDESFELVDITDQITAIFNPDEATKQIIENVKAMEPVPIEKISINPME
jgi:Skp family chaperone for outer membrane proteins